MIPQIKFLHTDEKNGKSVTIIIIIIMSQGIWER
jgi:hypothetical protein